MTCKPESFGYTLDEGKILFPDVEFAGCEKYSPGPSLLEINLEKNILRMNCSGKYLLGPNIEHLGRTEFKGGLETYTKEVKLNNQEYAIGTCDKDLDGFFEYVEYKNRLKPEALNRAKKSLRGEPVNIAMVVLDSVSRRSFYRKLGKTAEFLRNLNQTIHDFKIHNVMGELSADSFMPTFMGDRPFERLHEERLEGDPYHDDLI